MKGRYARVMGDMWRNTRIEPVSFGARGLLLGILSFCADQANDGVITGKAMQKLLEGNPNGRRMVRNLIDHGFISASGDDFVVVSWTKYNIAKSEWDERGVGSAVGSVTGSGVGSVTRSVMNAPEQSHGVRSTLSRPMTHDPRPIEENNVRVAGSTGPKRQEGSASVASQSESNDVRRVFDSWVELFWSGRGPKPKLTQDRRSKIKARLKEGFTPEQLVEALKGATKSEFHVEKGYTQLGTLLKSAGAVEQHMGRLHGSPPGLRLRRVEDLPRAADGGIV